MKQKHSHSDRNAKAKSVSKSESSSVRIHGDDVETSSAIEALPSYADEASQLASQKLVSNGQNLSLSVTTAESVNIVEGVVNQHDGHDLTQPDNSLHDGELAGVTGLEPATFCDFIKEFEWFFGHVHNWAHKFCSQIVPDCRRKSSTKSEHEDLSLYFRGHGRQDG